MGLALRKEDFDDLVPPPPPFDWSAAVGAVQDLNDFRRLVDNFEVDTRAWLAKFNEQIQSGLAEIENKIRGFPRADVQRVMLPIMDEVIHSVSEAIDAHAVPLHEDSKAKPTFDRLRHVFGPTGKFVRRQVNRIENTRVKRHNALVDVYYALLAFRAEIEEDGVGGETFTEPKTLGDFLRKQVA